MKTIRADSLKLKRAYEAPAAEDGKRILVDRIWPRGLSKKDAALSLWMKEIAPSPELRNGSVTILITGMSFVNAM